MKQLVYFADPMCSWCWGFAPQIALLQERLGLQVPILAIMGGLRPGTREPMNEALKSAVRSHWAHVAERTGQPSDCSFFDRAAFVYDTEPACRAVVTVRNLRPDMTLSYLQAVQQAFYAEGRDVTQAGELAACAEGIGLARDSFLSEFDSDEMGEATERDFLTAQRLQVTGFPTLFAEEGGQPPVRLLEGYRDVTTLIPALEKWVG